VARQDVGACAGGKGETKGYLQPNGGSLPDRVGELTSRVVKELGLPLGIHAHNDSGLAVANSLAAVKAGAVQVQGVLAGFGERCGNANLSTLVADLVFKMKLECLRPDSMPKLSRITRSVAEIANVNFDEGMPYVGLKAFAHKAGMHVDAVLKTTLSFEHVSPETVGNERRETYGHSLVADPWGHVVAKASDGIGVVSTRIEMAVVERVRRLIPVAQHRVAYGIKVRPDLVPAAGHYGIFQNCRGLEPLHDRVSGQRGLSEYQPDLQRRLCGEV